MAVEARPLALEELCCPACRGGLSHQSDGLSCSDCGREYPVRAGVPVLLTERSLYAEGASPVEKGPLGRVGGAVHALLPGLQANATSAANYERFGSLVASAVEGRRGRILVVGGAILGQGMGALLARADIELVETDAASGPRPSVLCDAQELPFPDGSFDGVIAQAVLPAVADADRAVAEIHRVLRPGGLVYAENSFMQPVWAGGSDFNRFPPSGQRRLFRDFAEIDSGVAVGPGSALAKAYEYFLLSFARTRRARRVLRVIAALSAFWLKWFDSVLHDRPASVDCAAGLYFLGRRVNETLSDHQVVDAYRGGV